VTLGTEHVDYKFHRAVKFIGRLKGTEIYVNNISVVIVAN
jgi:hypothetical protein